MFPDNTRGIPSQGYYSFNKYQTTPKLIEYNLYSYNGYLHVQNLIANTVLRRKTGKADARITNMVVPTKVDRLYEDTIMWYLQVLFNFVMIIMYVPLVYRTTYRIVFEKSSRAKDTMRIMGMNIFSYWMSWLVTYTIINVIICVLVSLFLTMNIM